jgi:putative transposase
MALRVLMYLHKNPVVSGFVEEPQYWLYSSALGYYGKKGLPDVRLLF